MTKKVIITGTSRGIGYELVKLFANKGHIVYALSRNTKPTEELKLNNIHSISTDLSSEKSINNTIDEIKKSTNNIDILINNAGKLINRPFEKLTQKDFLDVYQVNVIGVALLIQKTIPLLKENSHVVTVSSMGGVQGSMKFPGLAAYSSSKGAVITLSELLAEEFKDKKISFNTLALGAVQTEMLKEAFPEYEAPLTALEMANYIYEFSVKGNKFYNGKVLEVSSTTP